MSCRGGGEGGWASELQLPLESVIGQYCAFIFIYIISLTLGLTKRSDNSE